MEQRSYEWFKIRLGKITGSQMKRVVHGGPRAWASYARQLREEAQILARIEAGEDIELGSDFDTASVAWGRRWELTAIHEYEFLDDVDVVPAAFTIHKEYPFIGCSVDGEVSKDADIIDGVAEVKCPYSESVHLATIANDLVPDDHKPQIHTGIWVHQVDWAAFLSFDPRRDLARRLFRRILERDEAYITNMERRCMEFWEFVQSGQTETVIKSDQLRSDTIPSLF